MYIDPSKVTGIRYSYQEKYTPFIIDTDAMELDCNKIPPRKIELPDKHIDNWSFTGLFPRLKENTFGGTGKCECTSVDIHNHRVKLNKTFDWSTTLFWDEKEGYWDGVYTIVPDGLNITILKSGITRDKGIMSKAHLKRLTSFSGSVTGTVTEAIVECSNGKILHTSNVGYVRERILSIHPVMYKGD